MKIFYFVSSTHRYDEAIYFGVGPPFGMAYGWPVKSLSELSDCDCDIGIIDNRLERDDVAALELFFSRPAERRFPIFFRISDSDMPVSTNPHVQFIFACGDRPGVHFATTYDVEGPFKTYVSKLKRSRVLFLPYPYDRAREVELDLSQRRRQIFLSGAESPRLYPLRHALRVKRQQSWLLKLAVHELQHPGYPDLGVQLKHNIVREQFVSYAAGYTHFFLCPSMYRSEFAKYLECAYAGSVPIGEPPTSLAASVSNCFLTWHGTTWELIRTLAARHCDMRERATRYREIVRSLRDPETLVRNFEVEASALLHG